MLQKPKSSPKINPGTYQIKIDPNCTTSSDQWVIYPTLQIQDVNINTTTIDYDLDIPSSHVDQREDDLEAIYALIRSIRQPVPLVEMTQLIQFRKDIKRSSAKYQLAHYLFSGGSAITTIIITIGCIAIGFFLIRCYRNPRRQSRNRRMEDHKTIPMMANFALPPASIIF